MKHPSLIATLVSSVVLLSGCVTSHNFTEDLQQPRPLVSQDSEAMQILVKKFPQYEAQSIFLALDTAVWEDESHKGGFDPYDVYYDFYRTSSESRYRDKVKDNLKRYGVVPRFLRNNEDPAKVSSNGGSDLVDGFLTSYGFSSSVAGIGMTTPGSSGFSAFGVGMGVASLLFSPSSSDDSTKNINIRENLYEDVGFGIELTKSDKKEFSEIDFSKLNSLDVRRASSKFFGQLLTSLSADVLKGFGFTSIGNVEIRQSFEGELDRFAYTNRAVAYQFLENDELGCPKIKKGAIEDKEIVNYCRVEFYADYSRVYVNLKTDPIVGGIIASASYKRHAGLEIPNSSPSDKLKQSWKSINEKLYEMLPKRFPNVSVYYPARKDANGVWEPQHILDKDGKHYFVVIVPRNAKVRTTAEIE